MAKRKTPKVKDLRPDSISEKQLNSMREIISATNENRFQVGALEVNKHNLLHQAQAINERLKIVQDEIMKEYGTLDIDINTGKIKYNDETNKKD
tara:strand:- start:1126 stop:1407 length:282 start_codon:yes stop_codon:yes gene_type:complete